MRVSHTVALDIANIHRSEVGDAGQSLGETNLRHHPKHSKSRSVLSTMLRRRHPKCQRWLSGELYRRLLLRYLPLKLGKEGSEVLLIVSSRQCFILQQSLFEEIHLRVLHGTMISGVISGRESGDGGCG